MGISLEREAVARGRGGGQDRDRDEEIQTTSYKMSNLQGYIIQHREYSHYIIIT